MNINELAISIKGKIIGRTDFYNGVDFNGRFTFLNDARVGDIVIRHWIDEKGVEIAKDKNIACIITQNPKDDAIKKAEELNFPLIIAEKIEVANAFALSYTISKFSPDSENIVVTGTNGKSTTSHLIYHILKNSGYHVFTNTDSESEFNTLIDPMVSKLISDEVSSNGKLDYLVIEISEVQGWLGKLMRNHATLMSGAIKPEVGVITNISMDHIGLVNSIDDVFNEIRNVPDAIGNGVCVLNYDDVLLRKLNPKNPFYISLSKLDNGVYFDGNSIMYNGDIILDKAELPFKSNHFIQNILSAIGACISLKLSINEIKGGIKSYNPLHRRFSKLNENPLIYDDFAHNPEGIKATISQTINLLDKNKTLYVVSSIRGSRGVEINKLNAQAIVESMGDNVELILSSSDDVVDNLNFVKEDEKEIFFTTLNNNNIKYEYFDNLKDALSETYKKADEKDIILLIGAQGMDPAKSILGNII